MSSTDTGNTKYGSGALKINSEKFPTKEVGKHMEPNMFPRTIC